MAQAAQPQREPEWWRARQEAAVTDIGILSQPRDQVRWGPIWAGVVVAIATMILLSVLGTAIGATAFDAGDETVQTGALVWGGITALIAFFLGGFTAGRTAAVAGPMAGAFNGAMVWALALVLAMLLSALGAGAAVGLLGQFGITGDEAAGMFGGLNESGLWWTFIAMAVGLVVAAVGGLVGAPGDNPDAGRSATRE